jgi:hypothetical protein
MSAPPPQHVESGRVVKNQHKIHVDFAQAFADAPAVVISTQWGTSVIHNIDYITDVGPKGFSVESDNVEPDLYINWVAADPH